MPGLTHRGPTHTVWFGLLAAVGRGGLGVLVAGAGVVAYLVDVPIHGVCDQFAELVSRDRSLQVPQQE